MAEVLCLGRELETPQGGNNSDKWWGARPTHPQVLHSPLTWPGNTGRGQGNCHQMQRGFNPTFAKSPRVNSEVGGDAPVPSRPGKAWPCTTGASPLSPFPGLLLLCWHQGNGWWELAGAWARVGKPERNRKDVALITMAWDQLELSNWVNWGENGPQLRDKETWGAWQGPPDENHHYVPTSCSFPVLALEHHPGVTTDAAWIMGKQDEPTVSIIFVLKPCHHMWDLTLAEFELPS